MRSEVVGLASAFRVKQDRTSCCKDEGISSGIGGTSSERPIRFKANIMLSNAPLPQGVSAVASSMMVHPKLQISALRPYPFCCEITSGAIHGMEPTVVKDVDTSHLFEQPKSAKFGGRAGRAPVSRCPPPSSWVVGLVGWGAQTGLSSSRG